MKRTSIRLLESLFRTFCGITLLSATQITNAALTHEYSFNDDVSSTNAIDSAGGATGDVYPGAYYPGDGTVYLDGASGFVYLPDDIISNYTSITFEIWTTPASNPTWARLLDFGTNEGGPGTGGAGGTGGNGLAFTWLGFSDGNGNFRGDFLSPSGESIITGPTPAAGVYHHIVLTVDAAAQTAALYDNGVIVAFQTGFTITPEKVGHTFNDYIGRSQYPDPYYVGSIDEFRIYDNAVTPPQVAADYESGPNSTSGSAGALASIEFDNPASSVVGGQFTPKILAAYALLTNNVNISSMSGITYSSDDTNVISYESDGKFHAHVLGSTTIHASFQSQIADLTVSVITEPAVVVHRYSFDGSPGTTTITDSVGGADGTLMNGTSTATLTGSGQLTLDGNASSGYVSLPSGMMAPLTNATFQIWVNNHDPFADWAELWAFGTNNGAQGIEYIALIPNNPASGKVRLDYHGTGGASVDAPSSLAFSNDVCVTVTYNYSAQLAAIYMNGRKVASATMTKALNTLPDSNNYLGQSEWYGSGDPYFAGALDEFRIYSGVESDLQIAIDAASGPNNVVTDPGALQSLTVTTAETNVDVHGLGVPVKVVANFANVSGVDVTTFSETTVSSSDTGVGTIVNGDFIPKNAGVSKVTATYSGVSGSVNLTVVDSSPWPSLLHRYTFNETSGTTINDSVGSINGTINGPVTLTGQAMITPSGNPAPQNGQPTDASGWVSFPANEGLVSGLPSEASIECWVVWNGGAVWQEIFDFGAAATPGVSSGGGTYLMLCPYDGANNLLRIEWFPGGLVLTAPPLEEGKLSQVVLTHDETRQLDKLYVNGELVSSGTNPLLWSSLPDTDNWLARDQWPDAMFNGAYSDMRIWNGALTAGQVANLYTAGPDVIGGPMLQIAGGNLQATLEWPANATDYSLQSTTNLVSGNWTDVSGTTTVTNGLKVLPLPAMEVQTYYRLKK